MANHLIQETLQELAKDNWEKIDKPVLTFINCKEVHLQTLLKCLYDFLWKAVGEAKLLDLKTICIQKKCDIMQLGAFLSVCKIYIIKRIFPVH